MRARTNYPDTPWTMDDTWCLRVSCIGVSVMTETAFESKKLAAIQKQALESVSFMLMKGIRTPLRRLGSLLNKRCYQRWE